MKTMKKSLLLMPLVLITGMAQANNITATMKTSANIENSCLITTGDVNFGVLSDNDLVTFRTYPGKLILKDSKLDIHCTKDTTIDVQQNTGLYYDGNANYLKHSTYSNLIPYAFYTDKVLTNEYFTVVKSPNNNHLRLGNSLTIKTKTSEQFYLNIIVGLYSARGDVKEFRAGDYADTVVYTLSF